MQNIIMFCYKMWTFCVRVKRSMIHSGTIRYSWIRLFALICQENKTIYKISSRNNTLNIQIKSFTYHRDLHRRLFFTTGTSHSHWTMVAGVTLSGNALSWFLSDSKFNTTSCILCIYTIRTKTFKYERRCC